MDLIKVKQEAETWDTDNNTSRLKNIVLTKQEPLHDFKLESTLVKTEEVIEKMVSEEKEATISEQSQSKMFTCHICKSTDLSGRDLIGHMQVNHPNEWIQCKKCESKYRTALSMKQHIKRVHQQAQAENDVNKKVHASRFCTICKIHVPQAKNLFSHLSNCYKENYHSTDIKTKCDLCGAKSVSIGSLIEHMKINHTDIVYSCKKCNESFPHPLALKNHEVNTHMAFSRAKETKPSHQPSFCEKCNKWFVRKWVLKNHLELHNKDMLKTCENCNNIFHRKQFERHIINQKKCKECSVVICGFKDFQHHLLTHEVSISLVCRVCKEDFTFKRDLRLHEQKHKSDGVEKPFGCTRCDKVFKSDMGALGCERKHTKKYRCDPCDKNFLSPAEMARHTERHRPDRKLFVCRKCNPDPDLIGTKPNRSTTFSKKEALENHMKRSHLDGIENFSCHICYLQMKSVADVTKHVKHKHNDEWLKCEFCAQQFRAWYTLDDHLKRSHADMDIFFECHECFLMFADIKTHMKEKHPGVFVKCENVECSEMFRSKELLDKHKEDQHFIISAKEGLSHTCNVCLKVVKSRALLVHHSLTHSSQKYLSCPKCPYKASRPYILKQHIESHNESFSFPCDECCKNFKTKSNLTLHYKNTHLGMGLFKPKLTCTFCGYETDSSTYLKLHQRKHTGEKPYKCPECEQSFARKFVINQHCQRMHNYSKKDLMEAGMYTEMAQNRFNSL